MFVAEVEVVVNAVGALAIHHVLVPVEDIQECRTDHSGNGLDVDADALSVATSVDGNALFGKCQQAFAHDVHLIQSDDRERSQTILVLEVPIDMSIGTFSCSCTRHHVSSGNEGIVAKGDVLKIIDFGMVVAIDVVILIRVEVTLCVIEEELDADGMVFVKHEVAFVLLIETVDGIRKVNDDFQAG